MLQTFSLPPRGLYCGISGMAILAFSDSPCQHHLVRPNCDCVSPWETQCLSQQQGSECWAPADWGDLPDKEQDWLYIRFLSATDMKPDYLTVPFRPSSVGWNITRPKSSQVPAGHTRWLRGGRKKGSPTFVWDLNFMKLPARSVGWVPLNPRVPANGTLIAQAPRPALPREAQQPFDHPS